MAQAYSRTYDWTDDRDAATDIQASRFDTELDGLVTAINKKVRVSTSAPSSPEDGQTWVDLSLNPPQVKIYDGTNSRWRKSGGYVDFGNASSAHYFQTSLTTDATWRDLDLSAKVPKGAKSVLLKVGIQDNAINSIFQLRENGNTDALNVNKLVTQVADVYIWADFIVPLDDDAVVEYYGSDLSFTAINITVRGWWY